MRKYRRSGISLVELLVGLTIVGLLIALMLPAVQRVRESGARVRCQNNLRQLALGLQNYHARHGTLPPGFTAADGTRNSMRLSWHARVLPDIEQDTLWKAILEAYAADPRPHTSNHQPHRAIQRTPITLFLCPSAPHDPTGVVAETQLVVALTDYLGVLGTDMRVRDGVLAMNSAVKLDQIRDGTSNTLLIGERPPPVTMLYGWWYGGIGQDGEGSVEVVLGTREVNYSSMGLGGCPFGPYSFGPGDMKDSCSRFHFWSPHAGGANFAFADGSVRLLRYSADPILPALATRAGGEAVTLPD